MLIRSCSIIIHSILTLLFVWHHPDTFLIMIMAPILHFMILKRDSYCYQLHCHIDITRMFKQERTCQACGLDEWIRMRHCYKCNRCVHKYDHHCVLMGICIGQFNHKYYVLFLYSLTINELIMMFTFQSLIPNEVIIDEFGIETLTLRYWFYALSLIFLYFFTFMAAYLAIYHTYYMMNNLTTWEKVKRDSISYLKNLSP